MNVPEHQHERKDESNGLPKVNWILKTMALFKRQVELKPAFSTSCKNIMLPILQKLVFSKSLQNYATPPGFKYLDFQCYNHIIPPGLKKLICFVMLQNPGGVQ
ncbi:MAG: hypothetical protein DWQ05_13735 [Calditrichaeota bacterium]|nr:MAG: hypothetical protein DWQ05_13735 [Calditrichota bacterium]